MPSLEYVISVLIVITIAFFAILVLFFVLVGRFYDWLPKPRNIFEEEEKSDAPSRTERRWHVVIERGVYAVLIILVGVFLFWIERGVYAVLIILVGVFLFWLVKHKIGKT